MLIWYNVMLSFVVRVYIVSAWTDVGRKRRENRLRVTHACNDNIDFIGLGNSRSRTRSEKNVVPRREVYILT